MKPQKEGGGNNFFDSDIPPLLEELLANPQNAGELRTYLLMERIRPPIGKFACLRAGKMSICDGLSEMSVFSVVFTKNQPDGSHKILDYKTMGPLVRTKCGHSNEGGVNSGYAVVDSPMIVAPSDYSWHKS